MTMRKNEELEKVVKKGVEMFRDKHNLSAIKMMIEAGVSYVIVDRVLYQPNKLRSTD